MVKIQYIDTEENIAYVMKNPLIVMSFRHFRDKIGMVENVSIAEREC